MSTLFLKYRPQTFSDLVGQDSIRKTLQNALKAQRPGHAYLFSGSRGTGKTSTARIFAKGLICQSLKDGDPCGVCDLCNTVADGSLVDVIEIDAASNRGIDQIRDLREKIKFSPSIAKRKVYIIDEVHMLTKESFNALLKTLEEPPDHAFFCLATTEIHKLPETIISRCQVFMFGRFTIKQMVDRLKYICENEKIKYEEPALEIIAKKAEGGLRDAISLLEQTAAETEHNLTEEGTRKSLGVSDTEQLENLYKSLINKEAQTGIDIIETLAQVGADFRNFGHDFLGHLREKMHESVKTSALVELPIILKSIEEIEKALFRLKTSPIVELPLEIAIINICTQGSVIQTQEIKEPPAPQKISPSLKPQTKPTSNPAPKPQKIASIMSNDEIFSETSSKKEDPKKDIEPTPEPPRAPAGSSSNALPTTGQIQDKMPEIATRAGLPAFVKKSFITTKAEIKDGNIIFQTDSEFHREKLTNIATKSNIRKAFNEIFQTNIEIDFIKTDIQRAPASTPNNQAASDDFLVF